MSYLFVTTNEIGGFDRTISWPEMSIRGLTFVEVVSGTSDLAEPAIIVPVLARQSDR